jgi:flagellar biosynthetic protein FlhB
VPRSREISGAVTFLTVLITLGFGGGYFYRELGNIFRFLWQELGSGSFSQLDMERYVYLTVLSVIKLAGPLVLLTFVAAFSTVFLQGGLVVSSEPLKFNPDKINPAKNLQKVFSKRGWIELAKSLALISVVVYLSYSVIRDYVGVFQGMVVMDVKTIVTTAGSAMLSICIRVGVFLAVVAVVDYIFQRYKHEEELKMTKQEVKEDMKDTEGQPLVKARIRRAQREMARKRMLQAVEDADVVVTNPTHFAVALKYDIEKMQAPQVVAKGQDFMALRIRQVAEEQRIPVVEDPSLARMLYRTAEVGDEVPANLYRAVAKVLAYVYKLRQESFS